MRHTKANRKAAQRLNEDTSSLLDRLNLRLAEKLAQLRQEDEATDPFASTVQPPPEDAR